MTSALQSARKRLRSAGADAAVGADAGDARPIGEVSAVALAGDLVGALEIAVRSHFSSDAAAVVALRSAAAGMPEMSDILLVIESTCEATCPSTVIEHAVTSSAEAISSLSLTLPWGAGAEGFDAVPGAPPPFDLHRVALGGQPMVTTLQHDVPAQFSSPQPPGPTQTWAVCSATPHCSCSPEAPLDMAGATQVGMSPGL
jgi:hypothetical protein